MKYLLLFLLLIALQFTSKAQTEEKLISEADSTLILDGDTLAYYYSDFQPYATGAFEISNSPEDYLESLTIEGGIIWKNRLIAGIFATSLQAPISKKVIFPNDFNLSYAHGGFLIGYRTDSKKLIDIRFIQKVSFGEMAWKKVETGEYLLADKFTIINPSIGLDVNLSRYAKLIGSIGYRKTIGLELSQAPPEDFDGVTFQIGVSIGLFNFVQR